jgi:hypothetical protein
VVVVKGDIADFDSLPAVAEEIARVDGAGGKVDVLIKYVPLIPPLPSPSPLHSNPILATPFTQVKKLTPPPSSATQES